MQKDDFDFVSTRDLRIGLFVDLDVGWLAHPFASGRFRISTQRELEVLRGLGVERIRFVPARSALHPALPIPEVLDDSRATTLQLQVSARQAEQRGAVRSSQQRSLAVCERRFTEAAGQYRKTIEAVHSKPAEAARISSGLVQGLNSQMQQHGESALRLLNEASSDKASMHAVNVTVLCLLLGRALGMPEQALLELGLAAFLHDMGKQELTERVRAHDAHFSHAEHKAYQSHVAHSVRLGKGMALPPGALQTMAQHHEMADGSGFPNQLRGDAIATGAHILALVNRFDGLCNPARPQAAMTPHEALALIFSQQRNRFDGAVLSTFVRMVGVYPPGSVVQLNDERHALVVSVNAARPLKPGVIVHDPAAPRHEAVILDLETAHHASIRRSLRPANLPEAALDYLRPPQHLRYFFEAPEGQRNMGEE